MRGTRIAWCALADRWSRGPRSGEHTRRTTFPYQTGQDRYALISAEPTTGRGCLAILRDYFARDTNPGAHLN